MAAAEEKKIPNKKATTRLQVIGLIMLLLTLMTTSVITAMMATGFIDVTPQSYGPVNSMTDAMIICDRAIHEEHNDGIQTLTLDDLSSRSDAGGDGFRLYYEISMYRDPSHTTGTKTFYANCFVTASGRVKRMDLYEQKNFVPKAIRRSRGNPIGISK